jgi:hypothetical protein
VNAFGVRLFLGKVVPLLEVVGLEGAVRRVQHHLSVALEQQRQRAARCADIDCLPKPVQNQNLLAQESIHTTPGSVAAEGSISRAQVSTGSRILRPDRNWLVTSCFQIILSDTCNPRARQVGDLATMVLIDLLSFYFHIFEIGSGPRRFLGDGQYVLGIGGRNGVPLTYVRRPTFLRWARLLAAPTHHAGMEGRSELGVATEVLQTSRRLAESPGF